MPMQAEFFASPWWVNLLILIPPFAYFAWRRTGLSLTARTLMAAGAFGMAFGIAEAAVVVYLRAASGLLPGYKESLSEAGRLSANVYTQDQLMVQVPATLLTVEFVREAATIIMLLAVAFLAAKTLRTRCAVFLWTFGAWDIFYYVGLWCTIRWPASLGTPDVLFLIPVPWLSPVWFPVTVSALTMAAVVLGKQKTASVEERAI
jgi:hypothetical protein